MESALAIPALVLMMLNLVNHRRPPLPPLAHLALALAVWRLAMSRRHEV